jgi:hypothetical protein
MTTTKLEFVNRDCGLVAEAELLGDTWYIEVRTDAPLNTIAKKNDGEVWEWALQHGFKQRRPPRAARKPGEPMRVSDFPRREKPWPNMCG